MPTDENGNYYISKDNKSEQLQKRGLGVKKQQNDIPTFGDFYRGSQNQDWSAETGQYFTGVNKKYVERIKGSPEDIVANSPQHNVEEAVAETQKAGEAIGNAVLGNAVVAGTTFANTFATMIAALFAPVAGEKEGAADNLAYIYNNPVSKGLRDVQNWANERLPIYGDAKSSPTKFIAEFIKNAGFTEGTILSDVVLSAIPYAGPVLATILGPMGEAAFEAGNAHDEKLNEELKTQSEYYNTQLAEIQKIKNPQERAQKLQELNLKAANDYNTSVNDADRASNIVFGANIALLTATNLIEFSNIINAASRSAEKIAVKNAAKKAERELAESGMQLTAGQRNAFIENAKRTALKDARKRAGIDITEDGLTYAAGKEYAKAGANYLTKSLSEAFEEGSQDVIQRIPYYYGGEDGVNHYAESVYDDQARETVSSWMDATIKAISDVAKNPDTYVDMAMGFLTGAIGTPGLRRFRSENGSTQLPLTWNGGVVDLVGDIKAVREKNRIVDNVNEQLFNDKKFNTLYNDLVKQVAANNTMEEGVLEGDMKKYNDASSAFLYTHVRMLDKIGMTDHIKDTVDTIVNMNDEQLQSYLDSLDDSNPLKKKSLQDARESFKKAQNTIDTAVDNIKSWKTMLEAAYGDEMSEETEDNLLYLLHQKDNAYTRAGEMAGELYNVYERRAKELGEETVGENKFVDLLLGRNLENTAAEKETTKHIKELLVDGKDTETLPEDNKKMLEDLPKVVKSGDAFAEEYKRLTGNLEQTKKEEQDRAAKAVNRNQTRKNARDINSITDIQSARAYYNENKTNEELVNQMKRSDNEYIKKALALEESVSQILQRLPKTTTKEQTDDITAILGDFLKTAHMGSVVDTRDGGFGNEDALPQREGDTLESRKARFDTAIATIQSIIDKMKTAANPEGVPAENIVVGPAIGEVGGDQNGSNAESPNNSNTPSVPTVSGGNKEVTPVTGNGGVNIIEDKNETSFQSGGATAVASKNPNKLGGQEEIVEEGKIILPGQSIPNGEIQPAVQEFQRDKENKSMGAHAGGENRFLPHTHETSIKIVNYLKNQTRADGSTFNAFDFINKGGLEEYRKKGGKVYYGVAGGLIETDGSYVVLQIIQLEDGKYVAIGSNYTTITGEETVTVTVDGKQKEKGVFGESIRNYFAGQEIKEGELKVVPNIESTVKEVISGRNMLLNETTTFHEAMAATRSKLGTDKPDLHIVVRKEESVVGAPEGTRIDRDSVKAGTAYIAVPNAKGGYNVVALSQLKIGNAEAIRKSAETGNRYTSGILSAARDLAKAVMSGERDDIASSISELNKYVAIRKVDFILSKPNQNRTHPIFYIKECVVDGEGFPVKKDGKKQYVKYGGHDYYVSRPITPDVDQESLVNNILNSLAQFGCVSWVSQGAAATNNISFLEEMSKAGYLATHAPEFITRAAWYKLNPPQKTSDEQEAPAAQQPQQPMTPPVVTQKPTTKQPDGTTISSEGHSKMFAMFQKGKPGAAKPKTSEEPAKKESPKPDDTLSDFLDKQSKVKAAQARYATQKEVVLKHLGRILPQLAKEERVVIVDNLVSPEGKALNGAISLKNAVIVLNSLSATGTEYHEAFHYVFNLMLTKKQRKDVLADAKQEFGKKYNQTELEEAMADAFQEYMATRYTLMGRIQAFFERLKALLKGEKDIINNQTALFDAIARAKFASQEVETLKKDVKLSMGNSLEAATMQLDSMAEEGYSDFNRAYNDYSPKRMTYRDAKILLSNLKKRLGVNAFKTVRYADNIYGIALKKGVPTTKEAFKTWYKKQIGITPQDIEEFYKPDTSNEPFVSQEDKEYMESVGISDDMMETLTKDEVEWFRNNGHSSYWINQSTLEEREYAKSCS